MHVKNLLLDLLLVLLFSGICFSIDITSCASINSPGNYELTKDLTGIYPSTELSYCILVNSSNVNLNCKNFALLNDGTPNSIGILINQTNNISIQNCLISNYSTGFSLNRTTNSTIVNNYIFNISDGINLYSSSYNKISQNTISSSRGGIFVNGNSNIISSNNLFNMLAGFLLSAGSNNNISTNTIHNVSGIAYKLDSSPGNTLSNNIAYNSQIGYYIFSYSKNNQIISNLAYSSIIGIEIIGVSTNNSLYGNSFYNNSQYGIHVLSTDQRFFNNTLFANKIGTYIESANVSMRSDNYRANSEDLLLSGPMKLDGFGIIFDNPEGKLQNHSIVDIQDVLGSESYGISWSTNSNGSVPLGLYSFGQKIISINSSTNPSIDNLTLAWLSSELNSSFNESNFDIYYLKNWTKLNATFDPIKHSLSISSLNLIGEVGIFEADKSPPFIYLLSPNNGEVLSSKNTTIKFKVSDNFSPLVTCYLYLDGSLNANNISVSTDLEHQINLDELDEGEHSWQIFCTDVSGNSAQSDIYTFNINTGNKLIMDFNSSCKENKLSVTSNNIPVDGASILALTTTKPVRSVQIGVTDENGEFKFLGCGKTLYLEATKSGYQSTYLVVELPSCMLCRCPLGPFGPRCF